jgi:nitroreductase
MDLAAIDHVLTTTRSVRKRLDLTRPVEPEVIQRCIEIALQAPTGSNLQGWRFMVVTDPGKRAALAQIYGKARQTYYEMQADQPPQLPAGDLRAAQRARVSESSLYLGEHLHEVPVHIIPCIEGRMEEAPHLSQLTEYGTAYHAAIYGSIYPATWSLMLALRARGLGSAWTSLHLMYEKEAAAILGVPDSIIQAALLPVAYFKGTDFKPAKRIPAQELTYWDTWGQQRS